MTSALAKRLQATDSFNQAATKHGIDWNTGYDVTSRYDNFQIVGLPAAPGTGVWTPLTNQPPAVMGTCLLQTDATVMCQQAGNWNWYRLKPDVNGSYVNGTWSPLALMSTSYAPTSYASAVLPDGRVIVEGGYCNVGCSGTFDTQGFIYNPATNTWTRVYPPAPPSPTPPPR